MHKVEIVIWKDEVVATFESSFLPDIGEWIWIGDISYKIESRVITLDEQRKKLNISLICK